MNINNKNNKNKTKKIKCIILFYINMLFNMNIINHLSDNKILLKKLIYCIYK